VLRVRVRVRVSALPLRVSALTQTLSTLTLTLSTLRLRAFIEHAHARRREYKVDSEDVALGYWLATRTPLQQEHVQ